LRRTASNSELPDTPWFRGIRDLRFFDDAILPHAPGRRVSSTHWVPWPRYHSYHSYPGILRDILTYAPILYTPWGARTVDCSGVSRWQLRFSCNYTTVSFSPLPHLTPLAKLPRNDPRRPNCVLPALGLEVLDRNHHTLDSLSGPVRPHPSHSSPTACQVLDRVPAHPPPARARPDRHLRAPRRACADRLCNTVRRRCRGRRKGEKRNIRKFSASTILRW